MTAVITRNPSLRQCLKSTISQNMKSTITATVASGAVSGIPKNRKSGFVWNILKNRRSEVEEEDNIIEFGYDRADKKSYFKAGENCHSIAFKTTDYG